MNQPHPVGVPGQADISVIITVYSLLVMVMMVFEAREEEQRRCGVGGEARRWMEVLRCGCWTEISDIRLYNY